MSEQPPDVPPEDTDSTGGTPGPDIDPFENLPGRGYSEPDPFNLPGTNEVQQQEVPRSRETPPTDQHDTGDVQEQRVPRREFGFTEEEVSGTVGEYADSVQGQEIPWSERERVERENEYDYSSWGSTGWGPFYDEQPASGYVAPEDEDDLKRVFGRGMVGKDYDSRKDWFERTGQDPRNFDWERYAELHGSPPKRRKRRGRPGPDQSPPESPVQDYEPDQAEPRQRVRTERRSSAERELFRRRGGGEFRHRGGGGGGVSG